MAARRAAGRTPALERPGRGTPANCVVVAGLPWHLSETAVVVLLRDNSAVDTLASGRAGGCVRLYEDGRNGSSRGVALVQLAGWGAAGAVSAVAGGGRPASGSRGVAVAGAPLGAEALAVEAEVLTFAQRLTALGPYEVAAAAWHLNPLWDPKTPPPTLPGAPWESVGPSRTPLAKLNFEIGPAMAVRGGYALWPPEAAAGIAVAEAAAAAPPPSETGIAPGSLGALPGAAPFVPGGALGVPGFAPPLGLPSGMPLQLAPGTLVPVPAPIPGAPPILAPLHTAAAAAAAAAVAAAKRAPLSARVNAVRASVAPAVNVSELVTALTADADTTGGGAGGGAAGRQLEWYELDGASVSTADLDDFSEDEDGPAAPAGTSVVGGRRAHGAVGGLHIAADLATAVPVAAAVAGLPNTALPGGDEMMGRCRKRLRDAAAAMEGAAGTAAASPTPMVAA